MRARNFNIDSLAVSHTDQPDVSRMTITLHGDDVAVEQAAKQLYRLIDVLKVQEVTAEPVVAQELALVKIRATDANRAEILKLVELSKGRVVDLAGGVGDRRGHRARSTRSTRSSRCAAPTASRSWSGPAVASVDRERRPRAASPLRLEEASDAREPMTATRCTTTTTRTRRRSTARPSRSSATGRRATPMPGTSTSRASTSSSG